MPVHVKIFMAFMLAVIPECLRVCAVHGELLTIIQRRVRVSVIRPHGAMYANFAEGFTFLMMPSRA